MKFFKAQEKNGQMNYSVCIIQDDGKIRGMLAWSDKYMRQLWAKKEKKSWLNVLHGISQTNDDIEWYWIDILISFSPIL